MNVKNPKLESKTKLKIRQYWTHYNRPWYIVRYGYKTREYLYCNEAALNKTINQALIKAYHV